MNKRLETIVSIFCREITTLKCNDPLPNPPPMTHLPQASLLLGWVTVPHPGALEAI